VTAESRSALAHAIYRIRASRSGSRPPCTAACRLQLQRVQAPQRRGRDREPL
jgi:hypothetical protein